MTWEAIDGGSSLGTNGSNTFMGESKSCFCLCRWLSRCALGSGCSSVGGLLGLGFF
jgi:hypothetical protein